MVVVPVRISLGQRPEARIYKETRPTSSAIRAANGEKKLADLADKSYMHRLVRLRVRISRSVLQAKSQIHECSVAERNVSEGAWIKTRLRWDKKKRNGVRRRS
jgi:hypothetical protein